MTVAFAKAGGKHLAGNWELFFQVTELPKFRPQTPHHHVPLAHRAAPAVTVATGKELGPSYRLNPRLHPIRLGLAAVFTGSRRFRRNEQLPFDRNAERCTGFYRPLSTGNKLFRVHIPETGT